MNRLLVRRLADSHHPLVVLVLVLLVAQLALPVVSLVPELSAQLAQQVAFAVLVVVDR